jgi:CheY-like chemotaxis protein
MLPNLLLADVMMPELDGFRPAERIARREQLNATSRHHVVSRERVRKFTRVEGLERAQTNYLVKPFSATRTVGPQSQTASLWPTCDNERNGPNALVKTREGRKPVSGPT